MVALEDVHLHSETCSSIKLQFIRMKLTDHSHKVCSNRAIYKYWKSVKILKELTGGMGKKLRKV